MVVAAQQLYNHGLPLAGTTAASPTRVEQKIFRSKGKQGRTSIYETSDLALGAQGHPPSMSRLQAGKQNQPDEESAASEQQRAPVIAAGQPGSVANPGCALRSSLTSTISGKWSEASRASSESGTSMPVTSKPASTNT